MLMAELTYDTPTPITQLYRIAGRGYSASCAEIHGVYIVTLRVHDRTIKRGVAAVSEADALVLEFCRACRLYRASETAE